MRSLWLGCIVTLHVVAVPTPAQEIVAKSKIVSVGLFKNGLGIVKREVQIPNDGIYRLDASPDPVHGTFWIESNGKVEAAVKLRDIEVPLDSEGGMRPQHDLAGKKVTLTFRNDKLGNISGTVVKLAKPVAPEGGRPGDEVHAARGLIGPAESFLVLKTAKGRVYINPQDVMMIETEDGDDKVTRRKPVLVLKVEKSEKKPSVFVSYLTHGLAWAPSYRVDISDPKSLSIEMASVIRNELTDFEDAEIKLISGFPSVEFAQVASPLSPSTNLDYFFQELEGRNPRKENLLSNSLVNANTTFVTVGQKIGAAGGGGGGEAAKPAGEGVDLHFESMGKRSLMRDEALSLSIGKAKADYERVVAWTVGTSAVAWRYAADREHRSEEMWDVLVYKNPFKFPMTTAPAMVVENGRFNGQRTAHWANVGEETTLKITKSLSIRAGSREQEDGKPNESVVMDNKNYTKIFLKGELTMSNHRKEGVKMEVRHSIRGKISEIEGKPKVTTREESLEDINRIHDIIWTVTLKPGDEKKLTYKNSVLVHR